MIIGDVSYSKFVKTFISIRMSQNAILTTSGIWPSFRTAYFCIFLKETFCTVVILLAFLSSANAQQVIKGKVLDGDTNQPLEGVTIKSKSNNAACATDKLGNFLIKTDGDLPTLVASYIGHASKEFTPAANDNVVLLYKGNVNLEEVVITTGINHNHFNTISRIDHNLRPARSSQEFLRMVPGLFIAQHAGGGKAEQIFLRGFDVDHGTDFQVSVDGIPVNMVSHAHGQGYADLHF